MLLASASCHIEPVSVMKSVLVEQAHVWVASLYVVWSETTYKLLQDNTNESPAGFMTCQSVSQIQHKSDLT